MTDGIINIPNVTATLELQAEAAAADQQAGFDSAPWKDGVQQFRDATKWVIGGFASIGALIVTAVPFAAISQSTAQTLRFVVVGAALALGGVAFAIVGAASNLVPRTVYSYEIRAKSRWIRKRTLAHALAEHPGSVLPAGLSYTKFMEALEQLPKTINGLPGNLLKASLEDQLDDCKTTLDALQWYRRFEKARSSYRTALAMILSGAIATGIGVGFLLYGLHDPKADADTAKTEAEAAQISANVAQLKVQTEDLKKHPESRKQEAEIKKLQADAAKVEVDTRQVQSEIDHPTVSSPASVEASIENLRAQTTKLEAEAAKIKASILAGG